MAVFNAIEATIQAVAGADGVAAKIIYGNVVLHGLVAILCVIALLRERDKQYTS